MDNSKWLLYWRISTSSTLTRQNFFAVGLPIPQTPIYKNYSTLLPQGQGGQTRQGYKNVSILWAEMTRLQGFILKGLVETVLTAGTDLYLTVDYSDGTNLENWFVDISGVPFPVVLEPVASSRGVIYQNVTLFLNDVTIINNPATGL